MPTGTASQPHAQPCRHRGARSVKSPAGRAGHPLRRGEASAPPGPTVCLFPRPLFSLYTHSAPRAGCCGGTQDPCRSGPARPQVPRSWREPGVSGLCTRHSPVESPLLWRLPGVEKGCHAPEVRAPDPSQELGELRPRVPTAPPCWGQGAGGRGPAGLTWAVSLLAGLTLLCRGVNQACPSKGE